MQSVLFGAGRTDQSERLVHASGWQWNQEQSLSAAAIAQRFLAWPVGSAASVGVSHTFNIQTGNSGPLHEVLAFCMGFLTVSGDVNQGEGSILSRRRYVR